MMHYSCTLVVAVGVQRLSLSRSWERVVGVFDSRNSRRLSGAKRPVHSTHTMTVETGHYLLNGCVFFAMKVAVTFACV